MTVTDKSRWRRAGAPHDMTREEIIEELAQHGILITDRQFRSWVIYGLLPRSERRRPELHEDHRARALFPAWTLKVIAELVTKIDAGATIADLQKTTQERLTRLQARIGHGWLDRWFDEATAEREPFTGLAPRAIQRAIWQYIARNRDPADYPVKIRVVMEFREGPPANLDVPQPARWDDLEKKRTGDSAN